MRREITLLIPEKMAPGENAEPVKLIPVFEPGTDEKKNEEAALPVSVCPIDIDVPGLRVCFTPSRRKTTRRIRVSIEGEFTIRHISLLQSRILEAFANFEYVDFALHDISAIDLPAVQLLFAVKAICAREEKFVTIDERLGSEERSLLMNAGLYEVLTSCKKNK